MWRALWIIRIFIFSVTIGATLAHSQSAASPGPVPPTVTFTLDFPASQPEHYSIRMQADGAAHYQSSVRVFVDFAASDETDSFDLDFTASAETERKVFELAAKAGYFEKDVDSHKKLAFTGAKTLAYKDDARSGEATYNYSSNPAVAELTALLQNLSVTLECGHRLEYDHRHQKLALDEELKRMEELARAKDLIEVNAIQTILRQIATDPAVINVTRARAQALIDRVAR